MQILLGTDGSMYSRLAEELLVRIPEWRGAEVTVASVAPSILMGFASAEVDAGGPISQQVDQVVEQAAKEAAEIADAAANRLQENGVRATAITLEGDAGQELLEFAERNRIDAIAIGSRGMGAFQSVLLGSVARKLVSHAPCHVLIARSSKEKSVEASLAALESMPKLVATLGVDGSAGSTVAIDFVKRQGSNAFEKLIVVCAEPLSVVPAGIDPIVFADLYQYDHERAAGVARQAAADLAGCAPEVVPLTGLGRPGYVVGQKAKETDADLVIVGATRHGTLERFLIGSVSYELATDAPCSTMVIRPAK